MVIPFSVRPTSVAIEIILIPRWERGRRCCSNSARVVGNGLSRKSGGHRRFLTVPISRQQALQDDVIFKGDVRALVRDHRPPLGSGHLEFRDIRKHRVAVSLKAHSDDDRRGAGSVT